MNDLEPMGEPLVDVSKYVNREPLSNKLRRALWLLVMKTAFQWSWPRAFAWRRFLLRVFGARLTKTSYIYRTVRIRDPRLLRVGEFSSVGPDVELYNVDTIEIGSHCTVSMQAFLCTGSHDISDPHMELTHAPIRIEDGAWVCARAFVGPGVTVERGAVVAAAAVVSKSVSAWTVVAGNPAVFKKHREIRRTS